MASATVRHRPKVRRRLLSIEAQPSGKDKPVYGYQFRCTCGQASEEYASRRMAEWDVNEHIKSLPRVPPDQQCQTPREHGCKYWEPCLLCAGQLDLFEAEGSA